MSQVTPLPPDPCTVSPTARFHGDCTCSQVWSRRRQDQAPISSAQGCTLCCHPDPNEGAAQPPCWWAQVDVPSRETWVKVSLSPSMATTVSCVPVFTVTRSKDQQERHTSSSVQIIKHLPRDLEGQHLEARFAVL